MPFVSLNTIQGHQSFLLWCPSHVDSGLHGHLDLWVYSVYEYYLLPFIAFHWYCMFLWPCSLCCLSCTQPKEEESLFDLQHPPCCSDFLLYALCLHLSPPKILSYPTEDKALAVFYTILTPMLNPVIYSLRNKEMIGALRRLIHRFCSVKLSTNILAWVPTS